MNYDTPIAPTAPAGGDIRLTSTGPGNASCGITSGGEYPVGPWTQPWTGLMAEQWFYCTFDAAGLYTIRIDYEFGVVDPSWGQTTQEVTGGGGPTSTLVLSPLVATNPVNTSHTVTATVRTGNTPLAGATVMFMVGGANTASGSGSTDTSGQATFSYTGTAAGIDSISAFADLNNNGTFEQVSEPMGDATKVWVAPPTRLVLTPATATNSVGDPHMVTATVTNAQSQPVQGVLVRFSVGGANTATGSALTDANGQASFTYTGTNAGADTISAYADTNANNFQDTGEPGGAATKTWLGNTSGGRQPFNVLTYDGSKYDVWLYGPVECNGFNMSFDPGDCIRAVLVNDENAKIKWGTKWNGDEDMNDPKGKAEFRVYQLGDVFVAEKIRFHSNGRHIDVVKLGVREGTGPWIGAPYNKEKYDWDTNKDGTLKSLRQDVKIEHGQRRVDAKVEWKDKKSEVDYSRIRYRDRPDEQKIKKQVASPAPGILLRVTISTSGMMDVTWRPDGPPVTDAPAPPSGGKDTDKDKKDDGKDDGKKK